MKPPAKTYVPTETQVKTNTNEGMEGKAEWRSFSHVKWMRIVRYAIPVSTQLEGLDLSHEKAGRPVRRLEQQGTLAPHKLESISHCMLWHT